MSKKKKTKKNRNIEKTENRTERKAQRTERIDG